MGIVKIAKRLVGRNDCHWTRYVMNQKTRQLIGDLSPESLKVLEISGKTWKTYPFLQYETIRYPQYDICKTALPKQYDLIIAEQVFEHLLWPYRAGRNVYEMLNEGGYFLVTTPFLIKIHPGPYDCTRWTETGLKYFLAECGFNIDNITTGSWGNRRCIVANFRKWRKYSHCLHSLKNEPYFPVVVWALAKKSATT